MSSLNAVAAPLGVASRIDRAVLEAVAYGDLFDYPLTHGEAHRYLPGEAATPAGVSSAIQDLADGGRLARVGPLVTLPGRDHLAAIRHRRARIAAALWLEAERYGRAMARLPFVRMVAVTGALAIDNVEADADIDFLVVTERDRLWLCRALVMALVRRAALRGVVLCPNYFISDRVLALNDRSLFTAHELVQMVPIAGHDVYRRLRQANTWSRRFLPNATAPARQLGPPASPSRWSALAERIGRTSIGRHADAWERRRKLRRFAAREPSAEVAFTADCCKGHFEGHGQRILAAYDERLRRLDWAAPRPC